MRRRVVEVADCVVCTMQTNDLTVAFVQGYLAGLHVAYKGAIAEEKVCPRHAVELDIAVASYTRGRR